MSERFTVEERRDSAEIELGQRVVQTTAAAYAFSEDFAVSGRNVSLRKADAAEQDNTRPITSAAVYAEIGNINALLETI